MDPRKGNHFKVCFIGDRRCLCDPVIVQQFVADLVPMLRMRLLALPHVYNIPIELEKANLKCEEDEGGISCVGVLSTSHVALYTWPENLYAVLDVYSCRTFRIEAVLLLLIERFSADPKRVVYNDLSASLSYPFDLPG